ncbi:Gfo/Idh/MocA family protein [Oryzicola mucosus]|uniref:Gfo/Idh/MocA family oxidoreductase n=1 Tax=Oryzicola mucosus TaxID=2767425 RepID=A0A8J6U9L9_9HYPH|nr:Gfo/Idh/MocA family oxidoreductase [Oryzicola mucosus]MBD0417522.1 Gfo/Idh/MocA family oxidoreductase [Oryzicola mucosus]
MTAPLRCALIGVGTRAKKLYLPILPALAPWIEVVAVCTPNIANAADAGAQLGVPSFTRLSELLDAGLIEAALVLSSIESHHAVSVTLSRHGIHHLVETTMASTYAQASDMVETADGQGITLLVAENYFRFPFDRLAKAVSASGAIGEVKRITCYHDQVGFHGHARWIKFYDAYPDQVQALTHTMPTARHVESAHRVHDSETFRACHLYFPGDRIAVAMGGNLKGMLGRPPRPGFTEIDGTRGAIVRFAGADLDGRAELRIASDEALMRDGKSDHIAEFVDRIEQATWVSSSVAIPGGKVELENSLRPGSISGKKLREWDATVVMQIVVEFAEQVRGLRRAQFSTLDALKATEIEAACCESARRGGQRIMLAGDAASFETDLATARSLNERFGVDHLDADAMIAMHFPPAA